MDDLGNRKSAHPRLGSNITCQTNPLTNRYERITQGSVAQLDYDDAGNMTQDERGYKYEYDYENRIIASRRSDNTLVARYVYDALGRRIMKEDCLVSGNSRWYYYNDKWQITAAYNNSDAVTTFIYGNYVDEALRMTNSSGTYYYSHDQLYSPVVLVDAAGTPQERYEYDAFGSARIYDGTFSSTRSQPLASIGNPYLFTGREVDYLDNGSRPLQYNRHRYYSQSLGRWTSEDPLGIDPSGGLSHNPFAVSKQYGDSGVFQQPHSHLFR